MRRFNNVGYGRAFSPGGGVLAVALNDQSIVRFVSLLDGSYIGPTLQHSAPVISASYSSDGAYLITCTTAASSQTGSGIHVWNVATGQLIKHYAEDVGRAFKVVTRPGSHQFSFLSMEGILATAPLQ